MFVVRNKVLFTVYLFTEAKHSAQDRKSERTIKRLTVALTERGIIARRNGKRNGFWEVLYS